LGCAILNSIDKRRVPTFVIIGAENTGTVALHRYLVQHPGIFMAPVRDPLFFAFAGEHPAFSGPGDVELQRRIVTTLEQYLGLFENGAHCRVRGELSGAYLYYPAAARRLRELAPDTKLIVTLRCPADRAYSNFLHARLLGREPIRKFEEALKVEPNRISEGWSHFFHYRAKGWYYRQLLPWLDLFPREQIMINLYEDLRSDPAGLVRDIFRFIGVDAEYPINWETKYNLSGPTWGVQLRLFLQRSSPAARNFVPDRLRAGIKETVQRYTTGPSIAPSAIRREMLQAYAPDIEKLAKLLGRDLSLWFSWPALSNQRRSP
jgi:sulfotransferase family protein